MYSSYRIPMIFAEDIVRAPTDKIAAPKFLQPLMKFTEIDVQKIDPCGDRIHENFGTELVNFGLVYLDYFRASSFNKV